MNQHHSVTSTDSQQQFTDLQRPLIESAPHYWAGADQRQKIHNYVTETYPCPPLTLIGEHQQPYQDFRSQCPELRHQLFGTRSPLLPSFGTIGIHKNESSMKTEDSSDREDNISDQTEITSDHDSPGACFSENQPSLGNRNVGVISYVYQQNMNHEVCNYNHRRDGFTDEQVICLVKTFIQTDNKEGLRKLNEKFELERPKIRKESLVVYARAKYLLEVDNFKAAQDVLKQHDFEPEFHGQCQKLFYDAIYKENEKLKNRPLCAVDKYRLRKKHQLPDTIWDKEETIYCFKEKARKRLQEEFDKNSYPGPEEKKRIADDTNLSLTQVSNWFKNRRQRNKPSDEAQQSRMKLSRPKSRGSPSLSPRMYQPNGDFSSYCQSQQLQSAHSNYNPGFPMAHFSPHPSVIHQNYKYRSYSPSGQYSRNPSPGCLFPQPLKHEI